MHALLKSKQWISIYKKPCIYVHIILEGASEVSEDNFGKILQSKRLRGTKTEEEKEG